MVGVLGFQDEGITAAVDEDNVTETVNAAEATVKAAESYYGTNVHRMLYRVTKLVRVKGPAVVPREIDDRLRVRQSDIRAERACLLKELRYARLDEATTDSKLGRTGQDSSGLCSN